MSKKGYPMPEPVSDAQEETLHVRFNATCLASGDGQCELQFVTTKLRDEQIAMLNNLFPNTMKHVHHFLNVETVLAAIVK